MNKKKLKLIFVTVFFFGLNGQAADILSVLENSANQRLQLFKLVSNEDPVAKKLNETVKALSALSGQPTPEVIVTEGDHNAEAFLGKKLRISFSLAQVPEAELSFLVAHEMGHIALGHWTQFCDLYKRYIPGEVRPETTNPVMGRLGAEASQQAHRHEYEADAFAFKIHRQRGFDLDSAVNILKQSPFSKGDATHPSTARRVMQLRSLNQEGP